MSESPTVVLRGRYSIQRPLGRGGMAEVHLARDTELGRDVALKILAPHLAGDAAFRDRFVREARLAARLHHPNIVQVYDVGEDARGPFIVMEYVDGESLADRLRRHERLPPNEVVGLALQVCAGLEAAHAAALVHRDVKPANILLRRDGTVKLTDFGIARALDATSHTEHGAVLGTLAYLAPEQARGEPVTPAADLYSLGVVLYEALTGTRPVAGPAIPLGRDVPAGLADAIRSCLALDPGGRPPSAAALARRLDSSEPARTAPRRRRGAVWAWAAAALLLLALGLGLGFAFRSSPAPRSLPATTRTARPSLPPVTSTRAAVSQATPPPAPRVGPSCVALDRLARQIEAEKQALDGPHGPKPLHGKRKGPKEKGPDGARAAQRHALDERKHQLDTRRKSCH